MTAHVGPYYRSDGLIYAYDAKNPKSYSGTGTTINDLAGTYSSSMLGGVSHSNGSFIFDGVDSRIDCGNVTEIGASLTGLTIDVWLKTTAKTVKCIAENGTAYTTNTFYFFQENANNFTFSVYGSNGINNSHDVVFSNFIYQVDVWYNLVGVWESGYPVEMFCNGVICSGSHAGGTPRTSLINGNTNLFVGARAGNSYQFAGEIPKISFHSRALGSSEILSNFNKYRQRFGL